MSEPIPIVVSSWVGEGKSVPTITRDPKGYLVATPSVDMETDGPLPEKQALVESLLELDRVYQLALVASIVTGVLLFVTAAIVGNTVMIALGLLWLFGGPAFVAVIQRFED